MTEAASPRQSGSDAGWRAARAHDHFVQFYEDESVLLGAVEGYVGAGLQSGAGAVVVATRPHLEALEHRWRRQGLDLDVALDRGKYQPVDAAAALSRMLVDGRLRADRFASTIEPVIAGAAQRSPRVIAFGEMVALLWQEGRHEAAVELERLWNELARRYSFALFCAYPMSRDPVPSDTLRQVCGEHARTIPAESYAGLTTQAEQLAEICALQHKAQRLEQAMGALSAADQNKDEFLAMLGHELRNPLAPIRNAAQVLRLSASGDPGQLQICDTLDRQIAHMTRLLDDLVDVGRISRGKIRFRSDPVDVRAVVSGALEASRPLIDARRHRLAVSLPDGALLLRGDQTRLVQALGNLLNNAAKYTPEGGQLGLSVATADGNVEIRVRDDGIGIAPALLPRIFDIFVQGEPSLERSQGGLGIGLNLVRRIVEHHAGMVTARSAGPGQGSEFTIRLPLAEAARGRESRPAGAVAGPSPSARRILVVDDHRDAAESMASLLRLQKHEVVVAFDGNTAISLAATFQPEVVLMDIGLPGMNGYEVARSLRASGSAARLVAITGYGQPEDSRRALEAGFDDHFTKPVDVALVQRALSSRPAARSAGS